MKITSLVFWVVDATLSYKFYKKLGFKASEVTDRHAVVSCGGFGIMLVTLRDEAEFAKDALAQPKGYGMYTYIQVDDVDKKHEELTKLGLKPSSVPRTWDWGNREFVIKDPDGYKICFWQKTSK